MTSRQFTGPPLCAAHANKKEKPLEKEWGTLKSISVVPYGVCVCVWEGQLGSEYVLNYVLFYLNVWVLGGDVACVRIPG